MDLSNWTPPAAPPREPLVGRYTRLEPLQPRHAPHLWTAQTDPEIWRFIPVGPFETEAALASWVETVSQPEDPLQFAVSMQDGRVGGTLSLMRIQPNAGSIEIGYIVFTPQLQNTREATEAIFLAMKWSFDAGYRRLEWKCDAANIPSRRAAQRLGFSFEGIFRQAAVVKGRNRDTAWFAAIDQEWSALQDAFETWLSSDNFDELGQQKARLSDLTRPILATVDPAI